MKRTAAVLISALVLATTLPAARAATTIETIASPASGLTPAARLDAAHDVVSIYNRASALQPDVEASAVAAAGMANAAFALGRGASIGLTQVRRGATVVQAAPPDFRFPMSTTVLPQQAAGPLMGLEIARVLANGQAVMSQTTAGQRGALAGDVIDLVAAGGNVVSLVVGLVADDAMVGGTELVIGTAQADAIGVTINTRILLWGFTSRDAMNHALDVVGLTSRADVRVRRGWDPQDPDGTMGLARTKQLLGEFAYHVRDNGVELDLNPEWVAAYMPPGRELLSNAIPIRARCHNVIKADLIAALDEVAAAGLGGAIEVNNANAYGGCFYPRFNRVSGDLGWVSRHSWGQALDTNTVSNAQGRVPQMNCDVVRIFRKHNFAWGGNFLTTDGMHFEWVGERRDQLQYPSRYCPNLAVSAPTENAPSGAAVSGATQRAVLFAGDGYEHT